MKNLVQDFTTHPLVPGSALASIIGNPESRQNLPLDEPALLTFNKMSVVEIVGHFQNLGALTGEQAGKVLGVDNAGPMLLVKVPPGDYTVEATYGGKTERRRVRIGEEGSTVNWRWAEESKR